MYLYLLLYNLYSNLSDTLGVSLDILEIEIVKEYYLRGDTIVKEEIKKFQGSPPGFPV